MAVQRWQSSLAIIQWVANRTDVLKSSVTNIEAKSAMYKIKVFEKPRQNGVKALPFVSIVNLEHKKHHIQRLCFQLFSLAVTSAGTLSYSL